MRLVTNSCTLQIKPWLSLGWRYPLAWAHIPGSLQLMCKSCFPFVFQSLKLAVKQQNYFQMFADQEYKGQVMFKERINNCLKLIWLWFINCLKSSWQESTFLNDRKCYEINIPGNIVKVHAWKVLSSFLFTIHRLSVLAQEVTFISLTFLIHFIQVCTYFYFLQ